MADTSADVIKRFLEDAIAAERSFETQLNTFAKESSRAAVKDLFTAHAGETRQQIERLTRRLEQLGGSPSTTKSLLAQVFNLAPRSGSLAREADDRNTSQLILAFAIENHECAMYESLANTADAAGDPDTAALVRAVQAEEKAAANQIWGLLGSASLASGQSI